MTIPLVGSPTTSDQPMPHERGHGFGDQRRFKAPRYVDEGDRATRLDHLVAVGSSDVRVHLERVNAHISAGSEEKAYGAIVDLFIASGASAHEVRSRVLFWAGSLLKASHRSALQYYVRDGLTPSTPMPAAPHSLLSLGVTGSLHLVGPASEVPERKPAERRPAPPAPVRAAAPQPARASVAYTPPQPRHDRTPAGPKTAFDPERTIIGFVKRYSAIPTSPTEAWYVAAPFGQCAISGTSVWFQVENESHLADELTAADVSVRRIDAHQLDPAQAQPAETVLWDLGAFISSGRLPTTLPTRTPVILRHWPDLTRVVRIREDTKLAATLSHGPTLVGDLPDRPNVRAFLAAAWVSGALVPATGTSPSQPNHVTDLVGNQALRGLVSRLRRKAQ